MEFGCKNFPGFTTSQILAENQKMMYEMQCETEQFTGRIIFMSMYNDTLYGGKKTKNLVLRLFYNSVKHSWTDMGHFSELEKKRNGAGQTRASRMENGMMLLDTCCSTSVRADIPCSVEQMRWNEELCEAKEVENCLYTSVVILQTVVVIFRTINLVNQLSFFGAVADMCEELVRGFLTVLSAR